MQDDVTNPLVGPMGAVDMYRHHKHGR